MSEYFPFSDIISVFATPVSKLTTVAGSWTNGFYTQGSTSEVALSASSIQVVPQGEFEDLLPEGARRSEARVLYTRDDLAVNEEANPAQVADRIKFDNNVYEVKGRANHVDYYQYLLVKISEDAE